MVSPISLMATTDSCGGGLDAADLLTDLSGRLRGLFGQRFHFGRDHRKSAAGLACAGGFDRGIQRQEIGLAGNGIDQFDHIADPGGRFGQFADAVVGFLRLIDGFAGIRADSWT